MIGNLINFSQPVILGALLTLSSAGIIPQPALANNQGYYSVANDIEAPQIEPTTEVEAPITTPTPSPKPKTQIRASQAKITASPVKSTASLAPVDIEALIRKYATVYNADPQRMLIIAKCESGYRAEAVNGRFGGMYQFLSSTWSSNRKAMGLDPNPALRFNAEEAIKTAAFKMGRDGYGAWPACAAKANTLLSSK